MNRLRSFFKAGVWPFTPDPGVSGSLMARMGVSVLTENAPLLIVGNSRHTHRRMQRLLTSSGARLFSVDTGGLDLTAAISLGVLNRSWLASALRTVPVPVPAKATPETETLNYLETVQGVSISPSPAPAALNGKRIALLPYLAWEKLGAANIPAPAGWRVLPGPARPEELPAFLNGDLAVCSDPEQFPAALKTGFLPLDERMQIAFAQGAMVLACALIPLALGGLLSLVVGIGLALGFAPLLAILQPWMDKITNEQSRWRRLARVGRVLLPALAWGGLAGGLAWLAGNDWQPALRLSAAGWILAGWQTWLFLRRADPQNGSGW
jgi:hypothetical protein